MCAAYNKGLLSLIHTTGCKVVPKTLSEWSTEWKLEACLMHVEPAAHICIITLHNDRLLFNNAENKVGYHITHFI